MPIDQTFDHRRRSMARPRRTATVSDQWPPMIALAIMGFYASFFAPLRHLAMMGLAVAFACAVGLALIYGRRFIQPSLILFAAVGVVTGLLSYMGVLHRGLTMFFDVSAIPQQMFYTVALVFLVPAFAFYHQGVAQGARSYRNLELLIFWMALMAKAILALAGARATDGAGFGVAQLVNPDVILAFIIVRRWILDPAISPWVRLSLGLLVLVTSGGSLQSLLIAAALAGLIMFPGKKLLVTVGFMIGVVVVPLLALPFIQQIHGLDPNTAIRLVFWSDAIERLWESQGIGVGFGTETVRPRYYFGFREHLISSLDHEGFIHVGSHNALVDAAYKMGLAGFAVLAFYLLSMVRGILARANVAVFDCWVICTLTVTIMVNVALASINFLFGSAFLLGWLVYRLKGAERSAHLRNFKRGDLRSARWV